MTLMTRMMTKKLMTKKRNNQNPIEINAPVGRAETCSKCGYDLRCCMNCRFYDPGSYNECREPQAERVIDKERSNFCDYFKLTETGPDKKPDTTDNPKPGNPLDALFKK